MLFSYAVKSEPTDNLHNAQGQAWITECKSCQPPCVVSLYHYHIISLLCFISQPLFLNRSGRVQHWWLGSGPSTHRVRSVTSWCHFRYQCPGGECITNIIRSSEYSLYVTLALEGVVRILKINHKELRWTGRTSTKAKCPISQY